MKVVVTFVVVLAIGCSGVGSKPDSEVVGGWEVMWESPIIAGPISSKTQAIFFDENEGIATNLSQVKHTVNSGREWTTIHEFNDISVFSFFLDENKHVWGVGHEFLNKEEHTPAVVHSKDKGKTWSSIEIEFLHQTDVYKKDLKFKDICFSSSDGVVLASSVGLMKATVRGGKISIDQAYPTKEALTSVSCSDTGRVVVVGEEGAVYRYDSGILRSNLAPEMNFTKVKQIDDQIWLMGYTTQPSSMVGNSELSGILLSSADSGLTWENRTPKDIRFFSDIDLRNKKGWLTGSDGHLFHSSDNGESWRKIEISTNSSLFDIFFLDSQNIWIAGLNNTILKYNVEQEDK